MEILLADEHHLSEVFRLTHDTIAEIYPKYYRDEAVAFFHDWHRMERIKEDLIARRIYIMEENGVIVATGTVDGDHVNRLFVRPDCQGKGCGSAMMDFLERKIFSEYDAVWVDASLPAGRFYHKRGYVAREYCEHILENDKRLAYEVMSRKNPRVP